MDLIVALPSAFDYISICAGGGGLDLGLRLAAPVARAVCYVEREVTAAALLVAHMQAGGLDDAPVWSDLRTFDGRPWRGLVDAVVGGIPCQPWSVAGKRRGADDERNLWPDTLRVIREIEPGIVYIENVGGIVRDGYERLIRPDLIEAGYECAAGIFTASEVGTPHRRERLFILADARHDARSTEQWEQPQELAEVLAGSGGVGDPEHARWPQAGSRAGQHAGSEPETRRGIVGDADGPRLQGQYESKRGSAHELPAWPPGPAERDRWVAVLARWPDLAPAIESSIRDVADGLASGLVRRERLAILGNGVVPQQAAYAFRVLYERLA